MPYLQYQRTQEDQLTGKVPPLELAAHIQLRRSSPRAKILIVERFLQRSLPIDPGVTGEVRFVNNLFDLAGLIRAAEGRF